MAANNIQMTPNIRRCGLGESNLFPLIDFTGATVENNFLKTHFFLTNVEGLEGSKGQREKGLIGIHRPFVH